MRVPGERPAAWRGAAVLSRARLQARLVAPAHPGGRRAAGLGAFQAAQSRAPRCELWDTSLPSQPRQGWGWVGPEFIRGCGGRGKHIYSKTLAPEVFGGAGTAGGKSEILSIPGEKREERYPGHTGREGAKPLSF